MKNIALKIALVAGVAVGGVASLAVADEVYSSIAVAEPLDENTSATLPMRWAAVTWLKLTKRRWRNAKEMVVRVVMLLTAPPFRFALPLPKGLKSKTKRLRRGGLAIPMPSREVVP